MHKIIYLTFFWIIQMAEGIYYKANEQTRRVVRRIKERTWLRSFEGTTRNATETQIEQSDIVNTQAPSPSAKENRTFEERPIPVTTTATEIRAVPSPNDTNAEICFHVLEGHHPRNERREIDVNSPPGYCTGDVRSTLTRSVEEPLCFNVLDDCHPVLNPPKQERAYYESSSNHDDFKKIMADDPGTHDQPERDIYTNLSDDYVALKSHLSRLLMHLTVVCSPPPGASYMEHYLIDRSDPYPEVKPSFKNWIERYMHTNLDTLMPIYELGWQRKIKYYAYVFKRKKKIKTKKVFTETENELKRTDGDIMEIFHETYSVFEGPSEIPLMQPPEGTKRNESQSTNYQRQLRDVEADGIVSDLVSDPPGQQSLYIPPGDSRRETYRLSTFEQFPNKIINAAILARHGFIYTGFYDRVKCFSCGRTVEKWEAMDDPSDRKWHKTDCSFVRGHPTDNIPLGGGLFGGSFSDLVNSNASQPMDTSPSYLAQSSNGPFTRNPVDIPDLQRGGTYQMRPGSTFVIGSGGQTSHQTTPASQPPATSRPNNPPRGWRMANVISADHKRHLTNLYLNREIDRLASFARWPTGRPNVSPVSLARAGFFYLGDMDRTQCFSCGGVLRNWNMEDDAMGEHRMHFPNCRFVVGVERRNVPISERPEAPQELAERYPCRFPMNPHMRSEASRLQTFDRRWPMNKTRAKPEEIAEAGFFFLGERDRVKCWYCNGGLQNWEYDDIPWVEHSKWFPNCQFLLAKQGQLFVYRHLSLSPHLPRPIIGRQDGATVDPSTATLHSRQSTRAQDVPPSISRARAPSPPPAIIDPQMSGQPSSSQALVGSSNSTRPHNPCELSGAQKEELRKRRERVDKEMQSDTVKVVITMGYGESLVRRTLLDQLESGQACDDNNIFDGTASLLDAVMKKEEEITKEQEEERMTSIKFPSVSSNYSALTMGSMDTSSSMQQTSGVYNVSGFGNESDDEDRDLYSSIADTTTNQPMSVGVVSGATNALLPPSVGRPSEAGERTTHIWDDIPEDPESIKEFIEQKKEERLCKICFTETADMVFIPCSHMCCCKTCTEAIRNCPICRKKIEKAIKTYIK